MSTPEPAAVELDLTDVQAEMTDRGRLEWELAHARATNRKLSARLQQEAAARVTAEAELETVKASK